VLQGRGRAGVFSISKGQRSVARLRIALFAPYVPAPAHSGGRIRIYRLAKALAELGAIELFAYAGGNEVSQSRGAPELGLYRALHLERSVFAGPTFATPQRVRRMPRSLSKAFRESHARQRFDIAVVEHCYAGRAVTEFGDMPWVLDEHNIESEYLQARLVAAHGRVPLLMRREHHRLELWERKLWRAATRVVCVSGADAMRVEAELGRPPELVPNGVDTGAIRFVLPSQRSGHEILFVGLMNHAPNVRAAERLAREVLPEVQLSEPQARLVLCGANPDRRVLELARPDVEVTGRVDSVAPYLERAVVYANALEHGGGTSLKVLEAFASGLPVVSTSVGVRGFPVTAREQYFPAENSTEFAATIVARLRDRAAADAASRKARGLAETYDWALLGPRFAEIVTAAARR
jgi:polysaccharide biosynthesis protein PslH